ncbi:MAG: PTS sugar transporter subunit IIC [Bacilli bacterium]|nr:PTS sugar transporter subunit IIC [Bacilli bacterium]
MEGEVSKPKSFFKNLKEKAMITTNGMAIGLFGTLIIGTIINLFSKIPGIEFTSTWALAIQGLMGAGIGLGVALSLKKTGVAVVAITAAGFVGNYAFIWAESSWMSAATQFSVFQIGDPLSCYVSAILAVLAINFINKKSTPVDLLLIPLVGLLTAILYSAFLAEWIHFITLFIGWLIEISTNVIPVIMCILISVLTGMALTAPISSVAICVAISIGNTPLAAAAALIGCCTQMVGFAVQSARDNKWGTVLAIGLGTSMLQFKNIIKNPLIWLPTIISSALLGPLAMLIPLESSAYYSEHLLTSTLSVGAGMGTSGLVGPLNFLTATDYNWVVILEVIGFGIIAPIILVFLFDLLFRKVGLIKRGDLSLKSDI